MTKQHSFSGGLVLDPHKQVTEIITPSLPAELIYPLLQRADSYAKPIVRQGDAVLRGQVIASSTNVLAPPVHAASSGIVKAIAARPIAHPSGLSDSCIIIETDGLDNVIDSDPCVDYRIKTPAELRTKIHQAGIVGLGGAAFPTATKLQAPGVDCLIINGAECEPYISCDESLMQSYAQHIVQGVLVLQYILQATHCIIALEENMPVARQALKKATEQLAIQVLTVPAIYPTGGEKQLIQVLTGITVPAQSLPAEHGILCQNVATAYAVYQAICLGIPLTERIITLTGKGFAQAHNFRARIGTPIKHLVAQAGGYTANVQRLIMGGPMMGIALNTDDIAVTKATNCILAMNAAELNNNPAPLPCIRCGDCATVCPVGILPQQLYWYSRSQQLDQCLDYQLLDCIECACCDIVCPSHIPLVQMFRAAKGEHIIKQQQKAQAKQANQRYQNRQLRLAQAEQEQQEKADKRKAVIEKMKAAAAKRNKR